MTSLGKAATCSQFFCDSIKCTGPISAANKEFGPAKNQGQMHHVGSIFYLKWSAMHQCSNLATTNGSTTVTYTTNAAHNILVADTVHLSAIIQTGTINGIPVSELTGTVTVTAVTATTFSFATATPANATASDTTVVPIVRVDYYRYIDLASNGTTWSASTTVPSAQTHTNVIEQFYF